MIRPNINPRGTQFVQWTSINQLLREGNSTFAGTFKFETITVFYDCQKLDIHQCEYCAYHVRDVVFYSQYFEQIRTTH